eukprot:Phypoly_transcript_03762.p1 GENE.Phypoly_transcript_03762~~Phypoly_transcript_03762.p1  ORF type:complete len:477 (-),score=70.11 Phypoly_transcript_03762:325-1755(-)
MMCKRGDAHAVDKTKAFEMMERSAAQGNADAQNMLGIMLRAGVGCNPDLKTANHMFRMSAEQGHVGSRSMISASSSQDYEVAPAKVFGMLDDSSSAPTEIYNPARLQQLYNASPLILSRSADRLVAKNQSVTIEQMVNTISHFDVHQFDQILSAAVHLLVQKSSTLEKDGQLEIANAYKQVALNVGTHSLTSEAKKELQRTISSSFLLNKVAINNAVQQRVTEMHEKLEHKEEWEKQRVELLRRVEEMERKEKVLLEREERLNAYASTLGKDKRVEELTEKLKESEGKCSRVLAKDREWRNKVDNLLLQLEDIHFHNFLEEINRLIPKSGRVRCLIWYGCKDEKSGSKVRIKLSKIKADLNKAGMEVVIEGHKEFTEGEQSKVVICTQQIYKNKTMDGTHYSLEKQTKPPNFITLVLDDELTKSPSAIVLNVANQRQYFEKMISAKGLVPTLLELEDNETYNRMLEGYFAKIRQFH